MTNSSAKDLPLLTRRQLLQNTVAGAAMAGISLDSLAALSEPVVKTGGGRVQGEALGKVNRFLGIPYAQPISGANRFMPPQPVKSWDGVFEAVKHADLAPQSESEFIGPTPVTPAFEPPAYVHSGDNCLVLNVWAPAKVSGQLPVMVWLHGGGWISGSGSCAIYDGENLASRGDVVVVTINHRLGASGLTDLSRVIGGKYAGSSNLGIRDMLAALQWVNKNIAAFGGNPDLVTIFGESGGGWKVATMLGIPAAKGLFHRAVIESGPLIDFMEQDKADEVARAVLQELGISKDNAEKLDQLSYKNVVAAQERYSAKQPMTMNAPGFPTGFFPVLDDDLLPRHVFDPDAAPTSLDVPLMVGQTGTEFSLFMLGDKAAYSLDDASLKMRVEKTFGADVSEKILKTYRKDFPDYDASGLWFRIFSDFGMGALSSAILDARAVKGAAPVYAYRFDWLTPIDDGKLYSPHTMEIPFVFDNTTTKAGEVMTGTGPGRAELAKTISSAWVEFARTGKPGSKGLPEWPQYDSKSRNAMHLNTKSKVMPYIDEDMLEIFHKKLWQQAGKA